ncbi:MAG TPA: hypothetical protein VFE13_13565 [Caulobacteraceae bacterium]|jgi:hypothetical protein|nr:hypothetical protein [Caulobacteraceae bacterium]
MAYRWPIDGKAPATFEPPADEVGAQSALEWPTARLGWPVERVAGGVR